MNPEKAKHLIASRSVRLMELSKLFL